MNKKVLLWAIALLTAGSSWAQSTRMVDRNHKLIVNRKDRVNAQSVRPMASARTQSGQTIWSNDFSQANTWTLSTSVTGAGANNNWVIGTGVPAGSFPIPGIQSTTRANGFALFDSDLLCSGNQIANLTTSSNINLTGQPGVVLEFQQQYRRYFDSTFVLVSNDGGTTWTRFEVNRTLSNNDFCNGNPETVQLDISSVAGNQAQVRIRFQFFSPSSLNSQAGCGYAWMIDDVRIFAKPNNDLKMTDMSIIQGPLDTAVAGNYFQALTPARQFRPHTFSAQVLNFGSAPQPNARLVGTITKGSGSVYTNTFNFGTARPGVDTFLHVASPAFNPTPVDSGIYLYTLNVTSDSADANQADNTREVRGVVTHASNRVLSNAYLPPYNTLITSSTSIGTNSFGADSHDGFRVANFFSMVNPDTVTAVTVRLAAGTVPGGDVVVSIRDTAGIFTNFNTALTGANSFPIVLQSDNYTITSADTTSRLITIPIPDVLLTGTNQAAAKVLSPKGYFVSVEMFSNADANRIRILDDETVTNPTWSSLIFIPATATDPARWFTNGNNFGIGVRFGGASGSTVAASDLKNNSFKLFPNPTSDLTSLTYSLTQAADVQIRVLDLTGRAVETLQLGRLSAGDFRQDLNTAGLRAGVYMVELQAGSAREVSRLVIAR
jgi:hypothetical protein